MFDVEKKRHRLRIIDPKYPAFNIYSQIAKKTTALGPICVASSVHEMPGWDVEVIDENNLAYYGPKFSSGGADHDFLQNLRPADVVGFYGGLTSTIPRLLQLARFYKQRGAVTVAGGQHFVEETIPEALSSGVDYVVLGEGEETIKELLGALEGKRDISSVAGIAYLRGGEVVYTKEREPLSDFDALPVPDFSLVRYAKIKLYPVGRIRGCGMDCEFCTVKGRPRHASAERLLEQISFLLETKDARHFFIVDDLFGQHREDTIRFCHMLRDYQKNIRRRLDITVQIRLDKAHDSELLAAMRGAGINTVAIGFESPVAEELEAMSKRVRPDDMLKMTRIFHRFGFLVHGMFIFGYPLREALESPIPSGQRIKSFRRFIKKAKIDTVQVLLPCPLPGTELRRRLNDQHRVYSVNDVGWEYYDGNFPLFEPDMPLTAEDMQRATLKIMGKFYRLRSLFMIGFNVFSFASLLFFLHNIKAGWRRWYRQWRNHLARFGGWVIMRGWVSEFKKNSFSEKLKKAKKRLSTDRL